MKLMCFFKRFLFSNKIVPPKTIVVLYKILLSNQINNTPLRIWNLENYFSFFKNGKAAPLFHKFMEGAEFFWSLSLDGLEFTSNRVPTLYPQDGYGFAFNPVFRPLLNPPAPGQDKFDQILAWAKEQVGEGK